MRLDWKKICDSYGIPYVTRGSSVTRNHIAIKCPFCGEDDPSHHMGLNLDPVHPWWGCWRNTSHRGRSPRRLLVALLGQVEARKVLRSAGDAPHFPEGLDSVSLTSIKPSKIEHKRLVRLPIEARPLYNCDSPARTPFIRYLEQRGFDDPEEAARMFDLHYAISGEYRYRIVIPIYVEHRLFDFTSRTIKENHPPRYKTPRGSRIKETLGNWDDVHEGGSALVVVEGPFDMLKLIYLMQQTKVKICCTFGISITPYQFASIARLVKSRYTHCIILFDSDVARGPGDDLAFQVSEASGKPALSIDLVSHGIFARDPAEMTRQQAQEFLGLLKRYEIEV